ncbi:hypothetical protein VF21_05750 [Pseudogymnoascus sp. 05NY08]|nr:hypothetical protein VF21_05750 [Pseudogymnoascus sp. 05NY08]
MNTLPTTQTALVAVAEGKYAIARRHRLPTLPLPATYILVRISHVALNPCNWKMIDFSPAVGSVGGNDFAGEVVAVGDGVTRRCAGDLVCGFLYGLDPHVGEGEWAGAFAEYIAVDEGLAMKVAHGIGMADAACLGAGVITAGMALFRSLGLPPISKDGTSQAGGKKPHLLVYGGSTATGTMAIQLAKLVGYLPIATCSPANFGLVQSFGAVKAFDYHSPSCGVAIRSYTKGALQHALDCITDTGSMKICYAALGSRGGKYTALEPPAERLLGSRKDVQADWVMALTIFGKAVDLKGPFGRERVPEDMGWAKSWYADAEQLVASGALRPHPANIAVGGWPEVLEGIDELRKGKVRGQKLVYQIKHG